MMLSWENILKEREQMDKADKKHALAMINKGMILA